MNSLRFRDGSDVAVVLHSRRFMFWTVARVHYLVKNAHIEWTGTSASIQPTEALTKIVHPWWERLAFWVAGAWTT